ncbi:SMI1/KNR4 family protein [Dactylosporangium sp. NBC_01737]|uniref:SMI1/KNR4 family protein n=1 Tax=Dactylosporangium sp. NBC_01737 TaxID=2975959 RepID=UPI002E0E18C6|nr:SMI1/KNR4 family protein [Dactylosporangium sp. NBC_01737]
MLIDWPGVRARVLRLTPSTDFTWRELEAPLTPAEVDAVQRQLGVELPADYRQFLLHVGRGGPGPGYGVIPVRNVEGRWRWAYDRFDPDDLTHLAEPFPLRTSDWRVTEDLEAGEPDWFAFARQDRYQEAVQAWRDRLTTTVFDPRRTYGALYLCHEGCGLRQWLVVTGAERGHVWLDHRIDGRGLTPAWLPHHRRVTFGQWYLHWLGSVEGPAGHQEQTGGGEEDDVAPGAGHRSP